jgi:hypothetical protein
MVPISWKAAEGLAVIEEINVTAVSFSVVQKIAWHSIKLSLFMVN